MPDREKVIKGIQECDLNGGLIGNCPYKGILALLKEQEAVEPNPVHNSLRWFACGKCDCSITIEDRFCPRCGQTVKWE